jgi:hypothetical protein
MTLHTVGTVGIDRISVRGERALQHLGVYGALKRMLVADQFGFRVPSAGSKHAHADRVLFLNLTFWNAAVASDVLIDESIDADVLAHTAWHHAARKALVSPLPATPAALFLGESVASAFDLFLVGHMLRQQKRSAFLSSQVPAMSAAMLDAGFSEDALGELLSTVAADPNRAFEDLRQLLFDAALALVACDDLDAAVLALDRFAGHRFIGLLHHYEVSNWVLYARAYGGPAVVDDPAMAIDRAVRAAPVALDWLETHWLA